MKIAVLTQPLHDNYGGMLQAYALKETLKMMGHEVVIVNRWGAKPSALRQVASQLKAKVLGRPLRPKQKLSQNLAAIISEKTIGFRKVYIPELGPEITSRLGMRSLLNDSFDAFVVGSDQCWRPRYSPYIQNYFLDFAKQEKNIKRLSYAASFGTSDWEFTEKQTKECRQLLQEFDAISVREDDGVTLVNQFLGRDDAIHVLDPTMLLTLENYASLIEKEHPPKASGNLKVYVLDKNQEKNNLINSVSEELSLSAFEVMPNRRLGEADVTSENVLDFKYPCPTEWIAAFQQTEFVITDSFHGTVFSILYNKPFIALGNKSRGMSRFTSLLKMFGLEERLVTDFDLTKARSLAQAQIDWETVNHKLELERAKALDFLKKALA